MSNAQRVPLPCRHFHTAQGCPYGTRCKFDHYSNRPSYMNVITQKLHHISKSVSAHRHRDIIPILVHSVEQCVTQIIAQKFDSLLEEIVVLKNAMQAQRKLLKKQCLARGQLNKLCKTLSQQQSKCKQTPERKKNRTTHVDMNRIDSMQTMHDRLQSQIAQLQHDKKVFASLIHETSSISDVRVRARARSPSPFADMEQYEGIFATPTNSDEDDDHDTRVTMDRIVSMPTPPETKPIAKVIQTNVDTYDNNDEAVMKCSMRSARKCGAAGTAKKKKKMKRIGNKHVHMHRKKSAHSSHMQLKTKTKLVQHMYRTQNDDHHHQQKKKKVSEMEILPALCDLDWYQIIRSDSSDDDPLRMSTEDVHKLDMLGSI